MLKRIIPALRYLFTGKMEALEYAVKLHQAISHADFISAIDAPEGYWCYNKKSAEIISSVFFPFGRVLRESGALAQYDSKDYLEISRQKQKAYK